MIRAVFFSTQLQKAVLFIAITALWVTGCSISIGGPKNIPTPSIAASDLLLDALALPPRWTVNPCKPDCDPGLVTAQRSFGIVGVPGHVLQDVFYLGSEKAAQEKFHTYYEKDFGKSSVRSPSSEFTSPPEITYRSSIADEQYLGCGVDVVPACRAILRYDSYFVYFYFSLERGFADGAEIEADGLTLEQVETILRAMDERAARMLGAEAKPPGG